MTIPEWHGRRKTKGDDISDVISGEFFPDDDRPSLPLVREALQNAIDAGRSVSRNGEPVRVRIALRTAGSEIPVSIAKKWFGRLWPHISAERNGLKEAPEITDPCGVLVVEDFGTVGLTGDVTSDDIDGAQNNFVDFLRSDGRTRKAAGEQGSWGVGKNVFPRCSRINSYVAFTVRRDDNQRLLMGKCVLKIRRVDGRQFQPPVYLCDSWEESQVPMPHRSRNLIEEFCHDFPVSRRDEAGLSLVMPWVSSSIRGDEIIHDVVSQFYLPILRGQLRVDLDINAEELCLTPATLLEVVSSNPALSNIEPHIRLAAWTESLNDCDHLELLPPSDAEGPQRWDSPIVPLAIRETIAQSIEQRRRVAIRVPLHTRRKVERDKLPVRTFFSVYLEHDDSPQPDSRPRFFREQLCINELRRAAGAPRIRALVLIEDTPIAELLRNAEPPNHSDWIAGTANFKGTYIHGNHVVTFVKSAVKSIMSIVRGSDGVPDARIAIDYFSTPGSVTQTGPSPRRGRSKPASDLQESVLPTEPPAIPHPKPRRYRINELSSGFSILPGEVEVAAGISLQITIAYDVLSGNAWSQYEPADFDLTREDRSHLAIEASNGATYKIIGPNRILMRAASGSFGLAVTGFDVNRDLIVSARLVEEGSNDHSTAELHETD